VLPNELPAMYCSVKAPQERTSILVAELIKFYIERANKNPRDVFFVRNGPNQMRMTPVAPNACLRG
jgi:hypothetical protein